MLPTRVSVLPAMIAFVTDNKYLENRAIESSELVDVNDERPGLLDFSG